MDTCGKHKAGPNATPSGTHAGAVGDVCMYKRGRHKECPNVTPCGTPGEPWLKYVYVYRT